jgi:RNA recognition motif-containing protein
LWIGNIAKDIDEPHIRQEFEKFGPLESVRLLKKNRCGFVNFQNVQDAFHAAVIYIYLILNEFMNFELFYIFTFE